ncbi:MAG: hypothetical protein J7521_02940 [Caulobacter sp.]|nr:hypothetical protein [Caulobacter sp.]
MTEALRSDRARIYIDASVLIRCYEMSRSGCDELLAALEYFGARVRVPVWAAKETWDVTRGLRTKKPLQKLADQLNDRLFDLRTESLRYVDERTFSDLSLEQFTTSLDAASRDVEALTKRIGKIEPGHDDANAKLLPFIAAHAMASDMTGIYDEVSRTAELRFSHEVPPGFADGGIKLGSQDEEGDELTVHQKGKKRNRYGDLIMWLEALGDCREANAEHLLVLTRDNSKKDWVYKPDRVATDDGTAVENRGLITLPLPLLAQEAQRRCPTVQSVHVLSLEMFTQIVRTAFGARVANLARALQTSRPARGAGQRAERSAEGTPQDGQATDVSFGSQDMIYEPGPEEAAREVWGAIRGLRVEGWDAQNDAAMALLPMVRDATSDELKQIGRGIVSAADEGAIGPIDLAQQIIESTDLSAATRANVIVGMLAETYLDENGEPSKPSAVPEITNLLFAHAKDTDTRQAYQVTVEASLAPIRRLYLALPTDAPRTIRLELSLAGSTLQGVQADEVELLEPTAPESRRISAGGRSTEITVSELVKLIAREFVVPADMFTVEGPTNFQIEIPERMGFIAWGPNTGEQLR